MGHAQSENAPSTSCPSPQSYLDAYQGGEEDIYVVTLSALLSGSHNCAEQARPCWRRSPRNATSMCLTHAPPPGGEVLIALKIRELASTGMPFKRVVREVEQYIYQLQTLFVLESLENLRKNGRLTRVQSVVTGALRIKLFMAPPGGGDLQAGTGASVKQALGKLVDRIAADRTTRDVRWPSATVTMWSGPFR